jgi:hypothetical protein
MLHFIAATHRIRAEALFMTTPVLWDLLTRSRLSPSLDYDRPNLLFPGPILYKLRMSEAIPPLPNSSSRHGV